MAREKVDNKLNVVILHLTNYEYVSSEPKMSEQEIKEYKAKQFENLVVDVDIKVGIGGDDDNE